MRFTAAKNSAPQAHQQDTNRIIGSNVRLGTEMPVGLLAWTVEIHSMTCVVFAATKAKAQWVATKCYWDAFGRRKGEWPRAMAWRAKVYDKSRLRFEAQRAWSEERVMDSINC